MSKNNQNSNSSDEVESTASGMVDKAKETAARASGAVRDAAHRAREAVSDGYDQVSERTRDVANRTREVAGQWEQGVETAVQAKPLQAVLIAAGVGLAVGFLLGYEMRPSESKYDHLKSLWK